MLRLNGASLTVAGHPLLDDLNWTLQPGQRVGLVGRNGTGKSTLLRALADLHPADDGEIERRANLVVGYLPQGATEGSDASVWEVTRSGLTQLAPLRDAMAQAQKDLDDGQPHAAERLADATDSWRQAGGFAEDERVGSVLHGLGFPPKSWKQSCATLSGGWQMRVALARVLLSEPDVALLDEPTNHLDLIARTWLAQFLAKASFALVLVSHDRILLNAATQTTIELRNGTLHRYTVAYDRFLIERDERMEHATKHARHDQAERRKMERFVERFGAKNTKAAQARSIQKRLDKTEALRTPESLARVARIRFPDPPPGVAEVIALRDATIGWDPGQPVLKGLDLTLRWGERVAILGPNGCGKSTLLQTLAGNLELLAGVRKVGERIRIGVFHQDIAGQLPQAETAVGYLQSLVPLAQAQTLHNALGALGLSGDDTLRPIHSLSGGERARVAMASLILVPHNVLLLDEPSNHLDVETVGALIEGLSLFEGALVVVTHDRFLIDAVATHLWRVEADHVERIEDPRPEHLTARANRTVTSSKGAGGGAYAEQKRKHRERERGLREMAELETQIQELERQLSVLEQQAYEVAHSIKEARLVEQERSAIAKQIQENYTRWEALMEMLDLT